MNRTRIELLAASLLGAFFPAAFADAQTLRAEPASPPVISRIAAPPQPGEILLPVAVRPNAPVERWDVLLGQRMVRNVSRPTLTPVLPRPGKATGAAVIVTPGGAFEDVSLDNEGWPVARWLADHGVAAFVLKYRTNATPDDEAAFLQKLKATFRSLVAGGAISDPDATKDAQAALKLVHDSAARWGVDPARIGLLGFSAGAIAVREAALTAPEADRPAFLGYVYGPMDAIAPLADAPPLFAAIAMDDPIYGRGGFGIADAWRRAKKPVELHAYGAGGHGFGMGKSGTTSTLLMEEFYAWLGMTGMLAGGSVPR